MGQGAGHVNGTGRTRLWDRTEWVASESLDGLVGHVNGTGLQKGSL